MREAVSTFQTAYSYDREIRFEGDSKSGRIGVVVSVDTIQRLGEILKHTGGHAGHAVWHLQNPASPLPCSTCGPSRMLK